MIQKLLSDARLSRRIKVENYLLVYLGLRPCSLTTMPAEFPDAESMGRDIDGRVLPKMKDLGSIVEPYRRLKMIENLKREMRKVYKEVVERSEQYRAHIEWARNLELRTFQFEVRPTVRELYLFKDKEVEKKLERLMKERIKIRQEVLRHPPPDLGRVHVVYPEEFNGAWIREMGALYGYPRCCVDRYVSDREKGMMVEERASRQLREAGEEDEAGSLAYFVGYFFPCHPRCPSAISTGRRFLEELRSINPELGDLYKSILQENLELVRRQPEIIAEHRLRAVEAVKKIYRQPPLDIHNR
ncbi:DUF483 domain-containing protein [Candidatus Bathyarchaeota archaeon]|nr:DUF483 domain-containing protein [Candidatus Bathyarchaeota archaeon]